LELSLSLPLPGIAFTVEPRAAMSLPQGPDTMNFSYDTSHKFGYDFAMNFVEKFVTSFTENFRFFVVLTV
jgi:hypothetical protein